MCDGLKELHEQKIIHRDIKPSNMILQGERIRLIDFDAARIFKEGKESDTKLLGTKGYAPPEQFGHGQTDNRSDIYSLGVTMKTLLGENCDGRLKKILDKCTELDPKNRFQNVDELKLALTADEPRSHKKIAAIILITAGIFLSMCRR
ncbi:MAG: protein kinase [Selenomonadaceae bacterium]|nr:protein kinase [Selenomonadaceae bacterium]